MGLFTRPSTIHFLIICVIRDFGTFSEISSIGFDIRRQVLYSKAVLRTHLHPFPDRFCLSGRESREVKHPGHRPGIPGKVVSCHIVPLDPVYPAKGGTGLVGHVPTKKGGSS
jgi:hypothetical protein